MIEQIWYINEIKLNRIKFKRNNIRNFFIRNKTKGKEKKDNNEEIEWKSEDENK